MNGQVKENYAIGDLLWAKIGGHPFWPCMVSYHPYEGCYKKSKKVAGGTEIIYHVQYFGKLVQHGWTTPGLIFPFEGEEKFFERKEYLMSNADTENAKKKIEIKYGIPVKSKNLWKIAVDEAESALPYEKYDRYENFVFKYVYNSKKSANNSGSACAERNANTHENGEICENPAKKPKVSDPEPESHLCKTCETDGADVACVGYCSKFFHKECLGILCTPKNFKCIHCENGVYPCFICKKYDVLTKCVKCDNHYHEKCLEKFECSNLKKKICPLHVCLTCCREKTKSSQKGPLLTCSCCPTSFHDNESCVPAGCFHARFKSVFVCPDHFLGKEKFSPQPICNVSYCTACFEGGILICCETCPNSYHVGCITSDIPGGDFFCESCSNREYLYCGMIVWAKTGSYRWWPAEVLHYDDLPQNIKNLPKHNGEFPIRFFGTYEYFWIHRGRVIPYEQHAKIYTKIRGKPSRLTTLYEIGLEEAAKAYDNYVQERLEEKDKPDPYRHIRVNKAIPPAQINVLDAKSVLPCACDPDKPNPCSLDVCLNRFMLMECHPDVCKAKELCENQKFQRRQYASMKIFKTKDRGWGLQSLELIKKGTFVIEYVGEIITHKEYRRRSEEMKIKNIQNYYFLYIDSRRMIDAGPQGNLSRFINHSCTPNCEMVKWSVNGDLRIGIFAVTDIQPGDELTFNYQADNIEFEQECHCGTSDCQGFIGKKRPNGKKK